ncbi:magnesium/cobalt transporter CorA [Svornostia abyssi]|uniref:Magnesium transport protein CorA n=1 Tax=Svornostia abyssi TaxID=2898438 RepID=A0ABY5PIL9_9ACTN|nr:magnesium/cobalt transporter CorA [Parviterribacteraceae bacterium J379]
MIVDHALYRNGVRTAAPETLAELNAACHNGAGIAWIGLYRPDHAEFAGLADEFALHELAVEDAVHAHQRPKLERFGDTLFLVLRPARYFDETETVEFGEVHVFAGPQFVITVRHAEAPNLHEIREKLEARPDLLSRGTFAIVHAIVDKVVDDYAPVVAGIENDIDEIETEVFGDTPSPSRRIYELTREVIEFQRAVKPLVPILDGLIAAVPEGDEERRYLRDVRDHALRVEEQADGFRELLHNILSVNLTLETKALAAAANRTNDEVRTISAWAAIFFAPTLVGTVYGMNFEHMPELGWEFGYPASIVLMLALSAGLYAFFRRRDWL